jgi:hypothetical protein
MDPARNFKVLDGGGRRGVRCKVCDRFVPSGAGRWVLDLDYGTPNSAIVCASCVQRVAKMADSVPE